MMMADSTQRPHRSKAVVGYRFHPTDQELVDHFLKRKIFYSGDMPIAEVKVCDFEPWDLPEKSKVKSNDRIWYFFCPRDFKYSHSRRSNRTTKAGYWKPTGKLRKVRDCSRKNIIGTKKSLVFYRKQHPKAVRTEWIMHEYQLISEQGNFLLCKLKAKSAEKISKKDEPNKTLSASESEMVNSSCGECEPSGHVGSDIEDHNLNEMTAISPYDKGKKLAVSGISTYDNDEQMAAGAVSTYGKGERGCTRAFDCGSPNQNAVSTNSACCESEVGYDFVSDLEHPSLDEMTAMSTYDDGEPSNLATFFIKNQNAAMKTYLLVSEESEWSPLAATPDCGDQIPHEKADMSTPSMASGLEANAAEATCLEGLRTFFDEVKALIKPEGSLFE